MQACIKKERYARMLLCAAVAAVPLAASATTFTDQNGREVKLPPKVNRVATLVIPAASMVVTVDKGSQRLVGTNPAARREMVDGLLGQIFPAVKTIRTDMAGDNFAPNIEAILESRPDVVVQWGDRGNAIVEPIAKLGLPVVTLRYGDTTLAAEWMRLLGTTLTGREARGREMAAKLMAAHDEVAKITATVPEKQRPKVIYLYRAQGNSFSAAGTKTGMDFDIRLAGGTNVAGAAPGFAQVSAEQLLAWAPDVIILNNFDKDSRPQNLFNNPLLANVPAVKNKRVYVYPQGGFRWDAPSQESHLTWRWLLAVLHPGMKEAKPLRQEMLESYRYLYDYKATSADLDKVLRMQENGNSLHYREKFSRKAGGL